MTADLEAVLEEMARGRDLRLDRLCEVMKPRNRRGG